MFISDKNDRNGFTLIELLVVITIISVLASVVLVSLTSVRNSAKNSQRVQEMQSVVKALELYRIDNGEYPPHGPVVAPCTFSTCLHALEDDLVSNGYLGQIPEDPDNGLSDIGYRYCRISPAIADAYSILIRGDGNNWCSLRHHALIPASTNACWFTAGVPTYGWCENEI